jgi:sulfite exporter TauE/SafE
MKENFLITILSFFVAMLASGLFAEFVKHKVKVKTSRILGIISFLIGAVFVMPTYKRTGISQIFYFTFLIFFINFAFMILLPEKGISKK